MITKVNIINTIGLRLLVAGLFTLHFARFSSSAQSVREEIRTDVRRSAGTFLAYPAPQPSTMTPAPDGKKPFFLSHYGCQGSYYMDQQEDYDTPYLTLAKADSLGKLTPLGQDVMKRLDIIRRDAENRTGELTELGVQQQYEIIKRMEERFPETFDENGYVSSRCATVNRCVMSMEEAMLQVARLRPTGLSHKSSRSFQEFINPQDKKLQAMKMDSVTTLRYHAFAEKYEHPKRLMQALFSDTAYIKSNKAKALMNQLFDIAGNLQNTELRNSLTLYDIFTPDEIYNQWKKQNAWWYINYGGCTLNGGQQPYTSRNMLRYMIEKGDSVIELKIPVTHLRYTLETAFMPLVCLMDINGYGLATDDLESLEEKGWVDYRIAPISANLQMIYYRKDFKDQDVLVKVLLNEQEAALPVATDCAPYYHWKDVREYYLKKLEIRD